MSATVLSWTRVERPPAGFAPGRVVLLVRAEDGTVHYAAWEGGPPPGPDAPVALVRRGDAWSANPAADA